MADAKLEDTYKRYSEIEIEAFRKKYKLTNWRGQSDFNAVAHALTSAGLVYNHGFEKAGLAGEIREFRSMLFDKDYVAKESIRDNFNNKVGAAIAKYAIANKLPEDALSILVKDAFDRGLLAVSYQKDPRVNWYGAIVGRGFEELFDGPSPGTVVELQKAFGVGRLKAGSLSGPGLPAKDLGLTGVKSTPKSPPGSPMTGPVQTPGRSLQSTPAEPAPAPKVGGQSKPEFRPVAPSQGRMPVPPAKPQNGQRATSNPFRINTPQLAQQAHLLEGNPGLAKKLIIAAGRDPRTFGF